MAMKLTPDQQLVVLEYRSYVCTIAISLWRWAHIPTKYLDDLKSEACLTLCQSVINFNPEKGYPIKSKIILDVKQALFKVIKNIKGGAFVLQTELDAESDVLAIVDEDDNPIVDLILSLMGGLTDNQREVIELRYGLSGKYPMSIGEIAEVRKSYKGATFKFEKAAISNIRNLYQKRTNNVAS